MSGHQNEAPTLASKLEKAECQLLSLEVALQDAQKDRRIGHEHYRSRADFLQVARSRLTHLRMLLENDDPRTTEADLGLPKLEHCAFEELRVLDHFLTRRLNQAQKLNDALKLFFDWVTKALQGKLNGFFGILRLSKLKKMLTKTNNDTLQADLEEKHVEKLVHKFAGSPKARRDQLHLAGNLEAVVTLFGEIDALSHRISTLRSTLGREEADVQKLEEWLAEHENETFQPMPPPNMSTLESSKSELAAALYPGTEGDSRLTLARKFVAECMEINNEVKKKPWITNDDFSPFKMKSGDPYAS